MLGRFGDYTLLRKLGTGGMAGVFLARRDRGADEPKIVVLKRVLPHLSHDERLVELFMNEARIASRLDGPNIVRVFDAGRVSDRDYIAMEFVAGADLARLRDRCTGTPADALGLGGVVRLASDVCAGLHVAHEARDDDGSELGIVHGDMRPHNVMLTFQGVAKIIDFGVAQATAADPHTAVRGSYAYMAPEQLRGEPLDRRADVFAVGVLAWEAFAGQQLFKRPANYLTLTAVVEDPVPSLSASVGAIGSRLDAVLAPALTKTVSDRYPTSQALAEALLELADELDWDTSPDSLASALRELFSEERGQIESWLEKG
jgi:serine/threonine protein kinase